MNNTHTSASVTDAEVEAALDALFGIHPLGRVKEMTAPDMRRALEQFAQSRQPSSEAVEVRVHGIGEDGVGLPLKVDGMTALQGGVLGVVVQLPKQIGEMKCWLHDCKTPEQCAESGCAERAAIKAAHSQPAVAMEVQDLMSIGCKAGMGESKFAAEWIAAVEAVRAAHPQTAAPAGPLTTKEIADLTAMVWGAPVAGDDLKKAEFIIRAYESILKTGERPCDPVDGGRFIDVPGAFGEGA